MLTFDRYTESMLRHFKNKTKNILTLDELILTGLIEKAEDVKYLVESVKENKNIIFIGHVTTGKTTLLNALLQFQENSDIIIYERCKEIIIKDEASNKFMHINPKEFNAETVFEFGIAKDTKVRFVIDELTEISDLMMLTVALNMGASVFTTVQPSLFSKNWIEKFLPELKGGTREYVESTLKNHQFVKVYMDSCKLRVDRVERI